MKQKILCLAGLFLVMLVFCYGGAVRGRIPDSDFTVVETVAEEVLDAYLLEKHFPEQTLEDLDYLSKLTYYEERAEFAGEVIHYFNKEGEIVGQENLGKQQEVLPVKIPKEAVFSLRLSLAEAGRKERYLMIRQGYEWLVHPREKYADLQCISYLSDTLYMHDDGFFLIDMQNGLDGKEHIYRREDRCARMSFAGHSWYTNLDETRSGSRLKGYAIQRMDPTESAGKVGLQGYYFHCGENAKLSYEFESGSVRFTGIGFTQMNVWGQFEYDLTDGSSGEILPEKDLDTVTVYYDGKRDKTFEYAMPSSSAAEAELALTLSVAEGGTKEAEAPYLILRLEYQWLSPPETKTADPLFLSWELGAATMVDDSFSFCDQQVDGDGEVHTYQSTSYYASGGGTGCQWYADLDESKSSPVLKGSGTICVYPSEKKGTFSLQGLYVHKYDEESISCEITPSGWVSISNITGKAEYTRFPVQLKVEYDLTD